MKKLMMAVAAMAAWCAMGDELVGVVRLPRFLNKIFRE